MGHFRRARDFPDMQDWDGMDNITARMAQVPHWPPHRVSQRGPGNPWRERKNSGGSAMSATSEDDSLYDNATPHEKMSQGSAGSEFAGHEIPIMIEAEAPPGMMPPAPPAQNPPPPEAPQFSASPHSGGLSGPVPPLVGQVRKSPQFATRTLSSSDNNGVPGHPRATRCSSEPPQQTVEQVPHGSQSSFKHEGTPQATRSATAPIPGHNHTLPRQFGSAHKGHGSFQRTPAPIAEENFQSNGQLGGQPQPQQQATHIPEDIHRTRGHSHQPTSKQHDQPPFFQNPGGFNDYYEEPPPPQRSSQRPSVIRNIPIFIEGQDQPVVNEDHGSVNQSQPSEAQTIPQEPSFEHPQERPFWNDRDQFFNQHPSRQMFDTTDHVSSSPRQRFYSQQHPPNYYRQEHPQHRESPFHQQQQRQNQQDHPQDMHHSQPHHPQDFHQQTQDSPRNYHPQRQPQGHPQQQHPQHHPQQHPQHQHQQYQQHPKQQQQQPPQYHYSQPTQQPKQQQQPHHIPPGSHEIPIHFSKSPSSAPPSAPQPPPRQPSPQPPPPPPPVKLTPLERIDKVRASCKEYFDQVNTFTGTKDCKDYIYLDEMLTRALISLDDIDPDGNVEVRQHRKSLVRDIESTLSVLEKKASPPTTEPEKSVPPVDNVAAESEPANDAAKTEAPAAECASSQNDDSSATADKPEVAAIPPSDAQ